MHWSGCPQDAVTTTGADIGLLGKNVKKRLARDNRRRDVFSRARKILDDVPCSDLSRVLEQVIPYVRTSAAKKSEEGRVCQCRRQRVTASRAFGSLYWKRACPASSLSSCDAAVGSCALHRRSERRLWSAPRSSGPSSSIFALLRAGCMYFSRAQAPQPCFRRERRSIRVRHRCAQEGTVECRGRTRAAVLKQYGVNPAWRRHRRTREGCRGSDDEHRRDVRPGDGCGTTVSERSVAGALRSARAERLCVSSGGCRMTSRASDRSVL